MRFAAGLTLLVALGLAAPVGAQPMQTSESVRDATLDQLARRYVEFGGAEDMYVEASVYGFRKGAEARRVDLSDEQWRRMDEAVRQAFRPAAEFYVREVTAFYAQHNAREDLLAAIAFYDTPEGRAYVAASLAYSLPLTVYLATQGQIPLEQPPSADSIARDRYDLARELSEVLVGRIHPTDIAMIETTTFGMAGLKDYVARSLGSSLERDELAAALTWANSEPAQRLEGVSAERTLMMQSVLLRATQQVDMPALTTRVQEIMRETPA